MSSFAESAAIPADDYDGSSAGALARRLALPRVAVYASVSSTLDAAHDLARAGAPEGTLVIAERQARGRGRHGRAWRSDAGTGVWLTIIERPRDPAAIDVLSLRVGLHLAAALDALAREPVRLKWPNDLYLSAGKLAGVLVESRWRASILEWVAVGVGINVRVPPDPPGGAGLPGAAGRVDVLTAAVPAIRRATAAVGRLTHRELSEFAARDMAAGRECVEPVPGQVIGIDANGSLVVSVGGEHTAVRAGSLVLRACPEG